MPPSPDLLLPKLTLPFPRGPLLAREALYTRLDEALRCPLTLVSAPAGAGKTSLVSGWLLARRVRSSRQCVVSIQRRRRAANLWRRSTACCARQNDLPAPGWVSLDAGDNDPLRFWRYLTAAVQAFAPQAGQSILRLLDAAPQPPDGEALVAALVNALANHPGQALLVLEDFHAITNTHIHTALASLLHLLPACLHIVMLTRADPPAAIPLALLRARNAVCEIRAADLRFSEAETREFLARSVSHPLAEVVAPRLARQTEGWAAGLRLAALALETRPTPAEQLRFLETFSSSHRPLLDYLLEDVLASVDESTRDFLLQTSPLQRLSPALCAAITGRADSARLLHNIERANLFLSPVDASATVEPARAVEPTGPSTAAGPWYRRHPLFAEALRYNARQRLGEPRLREIAQAASRWCAGHGLLADAIEYALAASDDEWAAGLVERTLSPRLVGNEYHTLLRWLEALPQPVLHAHPDLCFAYAQAVLFTARHAAPEVVDRLRGPLEAAERRWQTAENDSKMGRLLAFRAMLFVRQGDYPRAFPLARQALALLAESSPLDGPDAVSAAEWRGICLIFTGWEAYFAGRLHAARAALVEARAVLGPLGSTYGMLNAAIALGEVHALRGEAGQAAALFNQAYSDAEQSLLDRPDKIKRQGRALLGLASLALDRSDLDTAAQEAARALAVAQETGSQELLALASWVMAAVEWEHAHLPQASARLAALGARLDQPMLVRLVQAWQARLALAAGDLPTAAQWAAGVEKTAGFITTGCQAAGSKAAGSFPPLYREQEELVYARFLLAAGQPGAALSRLEALRTAAREQGRARSAVEFQLLIALAEAALGHPAPARQALAHALTAASPESCLHLYRREGEPLAALLRELAAQTDPALAKPARAVLAAMPPAQAAAQSGEAPAGDAPEGNPLRSRLTDQEERILRQLGAGQSNSEIAEECFISVNTVKTHIKSIYRKLGVNTRRAARAAARSYDY